MSGSSKQERVIVIDDKNQSFDGVNYRLYGDYYQSNVPSKNRLHRAVWEYYNGEIPSDCHIHHINHDRHNNQIENLSCVNATEHLRYHAIEKGGIPKWAMPLGIEAAKEWHASKAGHEWHKQQFQKTKDRLFAEQIMTCDYCKSEYKAFPNSKGRVNTFCSNNCKSAWRRASGLDDIEKTCSYCSGKFIANKYQKTLYCSDDCRTNARLARKTA